MPGESAVDGAAVSLGGNEKPSLIVGLAAISLIWYCVVALVCTIGYVQLWRHWSAPPKRVSFAAANAPHVTVIRPAKGLEPCLYECLASTFRQDYPRERLHIRFCISTRHDPAHPILEALVRDFPGFDVQILIEDEDEMLRSGQIQLGPNPKIRNMARAYREAVGDHVWIIDCNVWVAPGVCGRMVARLDGGDGPTPRRRNKLVHLVPLVIDIDDAAVGEGGSAQLRTTNSAATALLPHRDARTPWTAGGGRMDEVFMTLSHAKFYTAFQTVLLAPCVVGKSTMFRRSHLDALTAGAGIDHFSANICEDHLIGDLLWKGRVPEERRGERLGTHALCFGEFAVQPAANMSVREFWSRRVRWLRVRKFTVTLATLVEPGIECFFCSLHGAFAATTLPFFHESLGVPPTWTAFAAIWLTSVVLWCLIDWVLYCKLHLMEWVENDQDTPSFARLPEGGRRRSFGVWLLAWLGRETLAFPIWFWAFYGGTRVEWRGRKFRVGMDMKVHEIDSNADDEENSLHQSSKARRD